MSERDVGVLARSTRWAGAAVRCALMMTVPLMAACEAELRLDGVATVVAYAYTHDYEVISALLRSSDWSHHLAIDASTRAVELGLSFPPSPMRDASLRMLLDAIEQADRMGGGILRLYARAVRDEVLRR